MLLLSYQDFCVPSARSLIDFKVKDALRRVTEIDLAGILVSPFEDEFAAAEAGKDDRGFALPMPLQVGHRRSWPQVVALAGAASSPPLAPSVPDQEQGVAGPVKQ